MFEKILAALMIAGNVAGPIWIHSAHGNVILNASEEGLGAILQAHQQVQTQAAAKAPAQVITK